MDELAVETTELVKRFPKQPGWRNLLRGGGETIALDGVNLAVRRGEIVGLLGPNGAGKTTLIKILCTLIIPTSGEARVAGLDVVRDEREVRRRIGLIYGDARSFYWRLSLVENLRFHAALYEMSPEAAKSSIQQTLELVGLRDAGDVRMQSFSSGMRQRAAIARGLLGDPEIILLDEPTATVDPVGAHEIRRMIRERVVQDRSRTVILTTNIMEEAEMLCDRLALLNHGKIELAGEVSSLRKHFQSEEKYILEVSDLGQTQFGDLRNIPGVVGLWVQPVLNGTFRLTLSVQRGSSAVPETIRHLNQVSGRVWSCTKEELSLDEMFQIAFGGGAARILSPLKTGAEATRVSS